MDWGLIIKASGITAATFVTAAFVFGFFRIKIANRLVIHRRLGTAAFILALTHGSIVVYTNYFM
ncbi:MAG TPA: hypothetical protein ENN43_08015 [bacterium]|nr:hypothetical protein [bacterium]